MSLSQVILDCQHIFKSNSIIKILQEILCSDAAKGGRANRVSPPTPSADFAPLSPSLGSSMIMIVMILSNFVNKEKKPNFFIVTFSKFLAIKTLGTPEISPQKKLAAHHVLKSDRIKTFLSILRNSEKENILTIN